MSKWKSRWLWIGVGYLAAVATVLLAWLMVSL